MSGWLPYPPCANGICTEMTCCGQGYKASWPELVGKNQAEAKATIERDNPGVTVLILPPGTKRTFDLCCNRVYVFVDGNVNVIQTPTVG
ncbi:hypothetical protein like AT3G46860 [Hibiscus trionum]|uniref:Uncharacterized protein n=1 Tax=Hibiscus trionum TaxID=183268 RepID=A0A9W7HUN3_HIBTR|nr:hypothetical protein like AT3G46860 [Hibiscus trionum]